MEPVEKRKCAGKEILTVMASKGELNRLPIPWDCNIKIPIQKDENSSIFIEKVYTVNKSGKEKKYPLKVWESLYVIYHTLLDEGVRRTIENEWGIKPNVKASYAVIHEDKYEHLEIRAIRKVHHAYKVQFVCTNSEGMAEKFAVPVQHIVDEKGVEGLNHCFVLQLKERLLNHHNKMRFLVGG